MFKGDEGVESIDAMFQINTCGMTVYSKTEKGCPTKNEKGTHFGEHIFIEPKDLSHEYMKSANLEIKLMDKGLFRDKMIASFEIDIPKAYGMSQDHAIHNRWLAMNDPNSDNYQEIKGYIKCSVAIQGPGDNSVKLQEDATGKYDELPALMPASIAKTYKQIKIGILTAKGIPDMDMALISDITTNAYISTEWEHKQQKTKVFDKKKGDGTCVFNEMFKFGILWPMTNSSMIIKAVDHDMIGDDTIGSIDLCLKDVVKNFSTPTGRLVWKQIYGAPLGKSGSECDLMNNQPSFGSDWMGKLLLYIKAEDAKYPEHQIDPINLSETDNQIQALIKKEKIFDMNSYEINAEVSVGICLPSDKKFKIKIAIEGNHFITKDPKQVKSNYNRWSERITQKFESECKTIDELGKIFIYLVDSSDNEISFWSGLAKDFTNQDAVWMWMPLSNNHAVDIIDEDHQAGMVQVKISLRHFDEDNIPWKEFPAWSKKPLTRLHAFKVRSYIYQCRELPILESDGSADAFIKLYNPEGEDFSTAVVPDSLNPIYYQTFDVNYECMSIETAPPIVLDVWDEDKELFDRSNDFMGRATIYLDKCGAATKLNTFKKYLNRPPQPQWHPIRQGFSLKENEKAPKIGEVLCAFAIVDTDFAFETPYNKLSLSDFVPCKEINIDVNFLGLRELDSIGMFPVKKAYVRFNTKNMLPPEKAQVVTNVQTEPKAPGRNPNVLTVISFSCDLPQDKIYCPTLSCEVFDNVCRGFSQPKLGNFQIPVGEIRFEMQEFRKHMKHMAYESIDFLKQKFPDLEATLANMDSLEKTIVDVNGNWAEVDRLVKTQKNLDNTRQQAQLENLFLADGSGSGSQIIAVGDYQSKPLSQLDISRVSLGQKPMFESIDQKEDEGDDVDTNEILKTIQEESKATDPSMPHYLQEPMGDAMTQVMTSRMDAPIVDLENDPAFEDRDISIDLSKDSEEIARDQLAQRQQFAQGTLQQSVVVQMSRRSGVDEGSDISFTTNTQDMKQNLILHIKKCQDGVSEEETLEEEKSIVNLFKMALFAKDPKIKNEGKKKFIEMLKKIRERQLNFKGKGENLLTARTLANNLIASEKPFLDHLQENLKAQSALKRQWTKIKSARDEIRMQEEGKFETVLQPQYKLDERLQVWIEHSIPAESLYQGVGYDHPDTREAIHNGEAQSMRHYRRYQIDELENNKEIFTRKPFHRFDITRTEAKKSGGLFGMFKKKTGGPAFKAKPVGYFKGKVTVYCPIEQEKYNNKSTKLFNTLSKLVKDIHLAKTGNHMLYQLDTITTREKKDKLRRCLAEMGAYSEKLLDFFQETSYQQMLASGMMNSVQMFVRLYVLEGRDFASRDIGGSSDTYIVVTCGDKVISERENYQIDESNPQFNKCYEFSATFPGAYPIEIEGYDYDDLFGDDLIGKTSIDLDDRQFCPEWKALQYKPIEEREIYHPSTCLAQGAIRCWLDIFDQSAEMEPQNKLWDISSEPIQDYEVRLCVLDTQNVPCVDDEGVSDVFVRAWIGNTEKQETDTHWRCSTGEASFNWRMLFNVKSPESIYSSSSYNLTIQLYDRDILSGNDMIAEYQLDLRLIMNDCRLTQRLHQINQKYYDSYFGQEYGKNPADPESEAKDPGIEFDKEYPDSFWLVQKIDGQDEPVKIRLDLRLLPAHLAKGCKVGEARSEPNNSPKLPEPVGRMEFSFNPFKMLSQLLGPGSTGKLAGVCCCVACCALCISLLPLIMGNMASTLINKMVGLQ